MVSAARWSVFVGGNNERLIRRLRRMPCIYFQTICHGHTGGGVGRTRNSRSQHQSIQPSAAIPTHKTATPALNSPRSMKRSTPLFVTVVVVPGAPAVVVVAAVLFLLVFPSDALTTAPTSDEFATAGGAMVSYAEQVSLGASAQSEAMQMACS